MTKDGSLGNLPSPRGELNEAVLRSDEPISSEALQGGGHGWRCHRKPVCEGSGDDILAFRSSLGNGLQIVLFLNRNHRGTQSGSDLCRVYHYSLFADGAVDSSNDATRRSLGSCSARTRAKSPSNPVRPQT